MDFQIVSDSLYYEGISKVILNSLNVYLRRSEYSVVKNIITGFELFLHGTDHVPHVRTAGI